MFECYVCMLEKQGFVSICEQEGHRICIGCYEQMDKVQCPMCRMELEVKKIGRFGDIVAGIPVITCFFIHKQKMVMVQELPSHRHAFKLPMRYYVQKAIDLSKTELKRVIRQISSKQFSANDIYMKTLRSQECQQFNNKHKLYFNYVRASRVIECYITKEPEFNYDQYNPELFAEELYSQ